jgi:hypothetical protein
MLGAVLAFRRTEAPVRRRSSTMHARAMTLDYRRDGIVFGVVGDPRLADDPEVARKYRDLTISWSRYGYRDRIVEGPTVDDVLKAAARDGYHACFLQFHGHVLREGHADIVDAIAALLGRARFLVAGFLVAESDHWWGLDDRCVVVNLDVYRELGEPSFGEADAQRVVTPLPRAIERNGRLYALEPSGHTGVVRAFRAGWSFCAASLRHDIPVLMIPPEIAMRSISLEPANPARAQAFRRFLGTGINRFVDREVPRATTLDRELLGDGQRELLAEIASQATTVRAGVVTWNTDRYGDVAVVPTRFRGPVTTLFAVASGFKPNRLLATHGMGASTRVVMFDANARALDLRRRMIDQWDGVDFPRFVRDADAGLVLHPHTDSIDAWWATELARWGGPEVFARHWRGYRLLEHRFVHCDVMREPSRVLLPVGTDDRAVIWWSNAFFTVAGNWFFTPTERRRAYRRWVNVMADANPELVLWGTDYNNASVSGVRAEAYHRFFFERDEGSLKPCQIDEHGRSRYPSLAP